MGRERCQRYRIADDGSLQADGDEQRSNPGDIEAVSPILGDIHRVANAFDDAASISIHLYGANIGAIARHVFDPVSGAPKSFVSGYSSAHVPNLWDRSASDPWGGGRVAGFCSSAGSACAADSFAIRAVSAGLRAPRRQPGTAAAS